MIIKGGKLDTKYKITVPEWFTKQYIPQTSTTSLPSFTIGRH
jgi:hypothetical protein